MKTLEKNSPNHTNVNFTNQDNLNLVIVTLKKYIQIFECKDANRNCLKSQIDLFKIFRLSKFLVNCTFKDDENFGKKFTTSNQRKFYKSRQLSLTLSSLC
jgi:hypothetical protein